MADLKEMNLARMLDKMGGDLANDLEWALARLDELKRHTPANAEHAETYVTAQKHLRNRRAYEEACDKAAALARS